MVIHHQCIVNGRQNKQEIQNVRQKVSEAIKCKSKEIYFTSCGSESDNLAIKGVAYAYKNKCKKHIITTKIEHPAILNTCRNLEKQGYEITYLDVDSKGFISLYELEKAIRDDTVLISVMFANNEIGTIEPIKEIGKIARVNNIIFHTDCVQAIGNVRIDVNEMNIDMLSMSAHKFYGPKGVGALYVREGIEFERIQDGGHQERNKRAGTENVPGIIGLGKAIELCYKDFDAYNLKLKKLRDYFLYQVQKNIRDVKINGDLISRLPGNANVSFKDVDGEELLYKLDEVGICASSGSACSSGSQEPSHVLKAIGVDENMIQGTLRVTFGIENTKEDVDYLIYSLIDIVKKIRNKNKNNVKQK